MSEEKRPVRPKKMQDRLYFLPFSLSALLLAFAVAAQPEPSLLTGFWEIQVSPAGLITDPMAVGGVGAALLNAALVLALSTLLLRLLRLPFTGASFACLFLMGGFALLGKNLVNIVPIFFGGWLFARYKREPFSHYIYLVAFSTCLAPMVSFVLTQVHSPLRWPAMLAAGVFIGFLAPAVAGYTIRIHQGYNLYNVGFAAGFLGLAISSLFRGFGVEFTGESSWSGEGHLLLCILMAVLLAALLAAGMLLGCRRWADYRAVLRHSGRSVADFVILDGAAVTLVNMALVGAIGFFYLLALYPLGVRLNGPLVCCLMSMVGFGAFGKHPKNIVPVMAGAVLAAVVLPQVSVAAPGVLLASLLCTGLAPISGQFGWYWGAAAGFIHMTIVQNTAVLHGGMNLYNNGFAAGFVCILLIPLIEALKPEPKE